MSDAKSENRVKEDLIEVCDGLSLSVNAACASMEIERESVRNQNITCGIHICSYAHKGTQTQASLGSERSHARFPLED